MKNTRSALLLAVCLFTASVAVAGPYPFPGKGTPVPCTGCADDNADLPTWPYDDPLVDHTGRYVDSARTINAQHVGMRTVRARKVRVSPATGRLYIQLGETVGGYPLDQLFTTILRQPMTQVTVLNTGSQYSRYTTPYEKIALPASFLYPEATTSGWQTFWLDAQVTLGDFDADDRGYVYYGSLYWGWGIGRDVDVQPAKHVTFTSQTQDGLEAISLFSLKAGDQYYAVISNGHSGTNGTAKIYDVTTPTVPALLTTRSGSANSIRLWDRYDAGQRIAVLTADKHLRIYDYASFLAGGAALADYVPLSGRSVSSFTFDENGVLWFTESINNTTTVPPLQKLTPGESGYTLSSADVLGTFQVTDITAAAGYLAIIGRNGSFRELRLFRVVDGTPAAVDIDNFFAKYYHNAPLGYASPNAFTPSYTFQSDVKIVEHADKTYLFYSAEGMGDVFELERSTVAQDRIATSIALTSSPNPSSGQQTVTLTATVTANAAGVAPPAGLVSFTHNGVPYASASLVAGPGNTSTATLLRTDLNVGPHQLTASFEGDDAYAPSGPATHTHEGSLVAPVISATANGTSSISVTWTPMSYAQYDVLRATTIAGPFQSLGLVTGGMYNDVNVAAGTTYLYKVQAIQDDIPGPISGLDVATTVAFSDSGLPAGTKVKAAHFTELRTAVQALRTAAGLSDATFTDPALSAGLVVKGAHYTELRTAANQARTALGLSTIPTTTPTTILRTHVTGLRDAIN